jgi:hypothetical protein
MNALPWIKTVLGFGLGSAAILLAGCANLHNGHAGNTGGVTLTGSEEVPPVATAAWGNAMITIASDMSVSGVVTVAGLAPFAAHIHVGARGVNGPITVGLVKTINNDWSVPAGAKITAADYLAFRDGGLYLNVHTAANKGGEIRGQLQP